MSAFELQQGYQEGISIADNNTRNAVHNTTNTKTRTILRIKRRRTETPIPCIRLEGLTTKTVPESIGGGGEREEKEDFEGGNEPAEGGRNNYNSTLLHEEKDDSNKNNNNGSKRRRGSAVLWKRFDPNNNNNKDDDERRNEQGEKYRIVDAMLAEESDDEGDNELKRSIGEGDENHGYNGTADDHHLHHHRRSKRRKLTLLDSSMLTSNTPIADTVEQLKMSNYSPSLLSPSKSNKSTAAAAATAALKKKKGALKVLDPLTRIVDDSLKEVLIGEKTIESHYRQLTTDPTFTLRDISSQRKWMTWNLNTNAGGDGGNILHCCALWNDASIANELLQRYVDLGIILMEAVDGDGRTPYEVAQLVGHERVCEILEIYGGDTTNYVYDVFYLDDASAKTEDPMMTTNNNDAEKDWGKRNDSKDQVVNDEYDEDGPTGIMTAELTSGVGYWTPEGELILEADLKHARSFSEETDGDIDSNCEEYGGNDYPEEYDEEQDGDDDADVYREYKQMRTMLQQQQGQQPRVHNYDNENYEFSDDDDNHDEYDWEEDL